MQDRSTQYPTLSKRRPAFPEYLDFQRLRDIGIEHIQRLSHQVWTDYNLHDPGITILEVLCYALTDLGYRNNLDIQDLLARPPEFLRTPDTNFFTADAILSCNPTTELDWRQRLIDIPGVRNAWLKKVTTSAPAIYVNLSLGQLQYEVPLNQTPDQATRLHPKGLYDVLLDVESAFLRPDYPYADAKVLSAVKTVLCCHRNVGEDFRDIVVLGQEDIGICADIELATSADPEGVLVGIYSGIQAFLVPHPRFYTLQERLATRKSPGEIFAGRPSALYDRSVGKSESERLVSHGFLDPDEVADLQLPDALYASDIYQIIMDVPGVVAIKKLSLINYINGQPQSQGHPWYLPLTDGYRPVLGIDQSTITFFKGDLPFKVNGYSVRRQYEEQQSVAIKVPQPPHHLDLAIPKGTYYDLADHYSVHHDFPLTYGIGEDGLPTTVSGQRQAQAKQLKGFLVFFDQLLANYLTQLAHVRDLFSWERESARGRDSEGSDRPRTYFSQRLTNLPDAAAIIAGYASSEAGETGEAEAARDTEGTSEAGDTGEADSEFSYGEWLAEISEDQETYDERRHRFLDHLLARFNEAFTDYVVLNYQLEGGRRDEAQIIDDKTQFLQDYPTISRDRFRGFDYGDRPVWDTDNITGFKQLVSRLLGFADTRRRSLSSYRIDHRSEDITVAVRPGNSPSDSDSELANSDLAEPHLTVLKTYANLEAARADQASILNVALQTSRYQPLVYRYFYHYGWHVVDQDGQVLATYDTVFSRATERSAILDDLVATIRNQLAAIAGDPTQLDALITITGVPESEIPESEVLESEVTGVENSGFQFRLTIPTGGENIQFTGTLSYSTSEDARQSAQVGLDLIRLESCYRPMRVQQPDELGLGTLVPEQIEYYSFGLTDDTGDLIATYSERFRFRTERDTAQQAWISQVIDNPDGLPDPVILDICPHAPGYIGYLLDAEETPLLQGSRRFTYDWAYLGTTGPDGNIQQTWHSPDDWVNVLTSLVDVISPTDSPAENLPEENPENPLVPLQAQVILAGETPQKLPLYRFELVAGETPWFVSRDRFLSQDDALHHGNRAIQQLRDDYALFGDAFVEQTTNRPETEPRSVRQLEGDRNGPRFTLVLLNLEARQSAKTAAWQQGNTLVELTQSTDNIRFVALDNPPSEISSEAASEISSEAASEASSPLTWELTNSGKDITLGH
ncbi:MAG: hypothetical protein F6K09_01885, partial [Merismopedia sp. SIO2A8]|nr:hypothetical protein [Merismopedia sp. SIO2A8]